MTNIARGMTAMSKDLYIYPAIFEYDEDGRIGISFPDLPGCLSCADSDAEALRMASDALGLHLFAMEQDGDAIPEPRSLQAVRCSENQRPALIEVHMPVIRRAIENASVKKTLTIPRWLNSLAESRNVNFSQVLQEALKDYLGLKKVG
jgi:predicted RNase H-like HicB family nuclease